MKIKEGYILRSVAGQHIVMPIGEAAVNFNGLIHLNESGKMLFETLMQGASQDDLVDRLIQEYDVERDIAQADVKTFLDTLKSKDVLDEDA